MNMNISMRDKKILLMFLGVAVFALGYLLGYRPQMEEAQNIQSTNADLEEQLESLLKLAENKDYYLDETASIQSKIKEYTADFPADIRSEDGIVLAQNMENSLDMKISNVGLGTREFVASMDGSTADPYVDMSEQTMSDQVNAQTQEQISQIDGENLQQTSGQTDTYTYTTMTPVLYRTQDSMQFTGTYAGLKDLVEYLADQSGRMTLDNVNVSFDSGTGNLSGSITVNLFSMAGTGKSYSEPDAGNVTYGTKNIFGTIESGKKSKKSKKSKKKTAETSVKTETAQDAAAPAESDTQAQ